MNLFYFSSCNLAVPAVLLLQERKPKLSSAEPKGNLLEQFWVLSKWGDPNTRRPEPVRTSLKTTVMEKMGTVWAISCGNCRKDMISMTPPPIKYRIPGRKERDKYIRFTVLLPEDDLTHPFNYRPPLPKAMHTKQSPKGGWNGNRKEWLMGRWQ